ncbi:hypothetical protein GBAR_LOCUS19564, partial [Geodia barretti]
GSGRSRSQAQDGGEETKRRGVLDRQKLGEWDRRCLCSGYRATRIDWAREDGTQTAILSGVHAAPASVPVDRSICP